MAAGVGLDWGSGTLTYKGKDYPVEVKGLSAGNVGATKIEASGKVYNLKALKDFDGNYTGVAAGASISTSPCSLHPRARRRRKSAPSSPGAAKRPNWLPAPDGPIYLVIASTGRRRHRRRFSRRVMGTWKPPGVKRVS